jgi:hypothetical protein
MAPFFVAAGGERVATVTTGAERSAVVGGWTCRRNELLVSDCDISAKELS